jgi:hypothetical protein
VKLSAGTCRADCSNKNDINLILLLTLFAMHGPMNIQDSFRDAFPFLSSKAFLRVYANAVELGYNIMKGEICVGIKECPYNLEA